MPRTKSIASRVVEGAILDGAALTEIECLLYFGYADIQRKVRRLRKDGFKIETRPVPLVAVLKRIEAALGAPVPTGPIVKLAHGVDQNGTRIGATLTEYRRVGAAADPALALSKAMAAALPKAREAA